MRKNRISALLAKSLRVWQKVNRHNCIPTFDFYDKRNTKSNMRLYGKAEKWLDSKEIIIETTKL